MTLPGPMALGLAALLYGAAALSANPSHAAGLDAGDRAAIAELRAGDMEKLVIHEAPRARLEARFETGAGEEIGVGHFAGKVVVLNLWATWCPPCRAEMPSLDALEGALGGEEFAVVPLSTDRGGIGRVRAFFDEIGIEHLSLYIDKANAVPREAAVMGLPVTLILDRQGREIARLTGDAEWDSESALSIMRRIVAATRESERADAPGAVETAAR